VAKLTLSVEAGIVRRAKLYAARHGTSISRLVERYLSLLSRPRSTRGGTDPPLLTRLRGSLKGAPEEVEDYRCRLERKYR
jgi:hypothetical protein